MDAGIASDLSVKWNLSYRLQFTSKSHVFNLSRGGELTARMSGSFFSIVFHCVVNIDMDVCNPRELIRVGRLKLKRYLNGFMLNYVESKDYLVVFYTLLHIHTMSLSIVAFHDFNDKFCVHLYYFTIVV